jgi:hypothetical protein
MTTTVITGTMAMWKMNAIRRLLLMLKMHSVILSISPLANLLFWWKKAKR